MIVAANRNSTITTSYATPSRVAADKNATPAFNLEAEASINQAPPVVSVTTTANGLGFDYDFNYSNIARDEADNRAYAAAGAARLSASQGLPAGKYDFTKITAKQATVIFNALAADPSTPTSVLDGFLVATTTLSDRPSNLLKDTAASIDFEAQNGNAGGAALLRAGLDYMTNVHASSDSHLDPTALLATMRRAAAQQRR